jgi:TonB-dependent receptor
VINNNLVTGGTFNRKTNGNTRVQIVNDDNTDADEVRSLGFNVDFEATDELTLNFDLSHSSADSVFKNGLLWALVAEDATVANPVLDTNVSISYLLNGLNLPDVGFNQEAAFSDIDKVMVSKYGIYPYVNSDEVNAVKLDGKYQLDNAVFNSLEAGVRYSEREYSNDRSVFEYGSDGAFLSNQPPLRLTEDMVEVVDFKGEFSHFPSYLAIDVNKALNAWFPNGIPQPKQTWGTGNTGILPSQRVTGGPDTAWSVLESGEVYEDVLAAYLQANIDTELFSVPVTGNIGVRMVETDQYASDLTDVGGDATLGAQNITDEAGLVNTRYKPGIIGQTYRDYLPQMNLNFAVTDSDQIRFAAAKVMSRPPIDRLASNTSYTIDQLTGQVNGSSRNSPFLKPFYATQYDISYEKYFTETDGAFVAAVFYKDIESFINTFTISDFDFKAAGFPIPDFIVRENGSTIETQPGNYTTAVNNDKGGYIRGAEIAYTQVMKFLPSFWQGLGFSGSYSYTESEIQQQVSLGAQTIDITLPGLSKNVMTATLFWEYEGFETRVSGRYRDNFVSEQVAVEAQTVNFHGETVIDYQASYQINDNFGVLFQVNNLTDEPTRSYFGEETNTGTIQFFGRQYFVGANYSF